MPAAPGKRIAAGVNCVELTFEVHRVSWLLNCRGCGRDRRVRNEERNGVCGRKQGKAARFSGAPGAVERIFIERMKLDCKLKAK